MTTRPNSPQYAGKPWDNRRLCKAGGGRLPILFSLESNPPFCQALRGRDFFGGFRAGRFHSVH